MPQKLLNDHGRHNQYFQSQSYSHQIRKYRHIAQDYEHIFSIQIDLLRYHLKSQDQNDS